MAVQVDRGRLSKYRLDALIAGGAIDIGPTTVQRTATSKAKKARAEDPAASQ
ncbi:MAG: hypothetical protein ABSF50_07620 [Burkholderiaceae bacterium]|jgi:hypothetical protein